MKSSRQIGMVLAVVACCAFFSPVFAAESFQQIRTKMGSMTDLQFKEYGKSLKGEQVQWVGWVEEVKEKFFGGYEVWIDMDSPAEQFSVQDLAIEVPKEIALKLKKDQKVTFTGTISSVMSVLGSCQVSLTDAKIVSY